MKKSDRTAAKVCLAKNMAAWIKMSDQELLNEVRKSWSAVSSATREECLKYLVIEFVEKNFDTY